VDELFCHSYITSPIGTICIGANNHGIEYISFQDKNQEKADKENVITKEAARQLQAYFNKELKQFSLPLNMHGTPFQQKVWTSLHQIAYGKTISYLDLAKQLGDAKCIRAAGTANGKNPFAIVVPCHRVIGKNGSLVGYAGGLHRKKWLLDFEQNTKLLFKDEF